MAKKQKKDRNKVNWNNPKTQTVVSYIQLGENRISKAEVMSLANKDIFYQLKNTGYIKETSKGLFIGTDKLHNHVKKQDGTHFSSSASQEHSQKLRDSLSLLPQSVLERKSFKTSYDIERQFNRTVLKSQEYKETLNMMKQNTRSCFATLESSFEKALQRCNSDYERYNLKLSYLKEREMYQSQLRYLSDKPYLIPDYQVSLTESERTEYIQNLEAYRDTLSEHSKAYDFYIESIDKLKKLPAGAITLSCEVITNCYGNREVFLHEQFELFSGTPQIFLM